MDGFLGFAEINILDTVFFDAITQINDNNIKVIVKNNTGKVIINTGIDDGIIDSASVSENAKDIFVSKELYQNDKYIVVGKTTADHNFEVYLVLSYNRITPGIREQVYPLLITVLLIILAIYSIIFLINNLIFRRLLKLVQSMREVENGNFSTQISLDYTDEIGHIKYAFNKI